ncbi:MAG TPA: hypothetical protein VFE20_02855, partial [Thermoleophilia bacterium]|nr:hypothetical protein [Thermoleophilia bacterium]
MAMYVELFGRDRYYGGMLRESREDEFVSNVFGPLRNFETTTWLIELLGKAFRGEDYEAVIEGGYKLDFWRRFPPPAGRDTPENDTEVSCVLETEAYTFLVIARYWHELSRQTARDVERDQIVRTLDTGYAALGDRCRLLVLTTDAEAPDLVSKYWDDPASLAAKMTDLPEGVDPEGLAARIGWTNWGELREALASR